MSHYPFDESPTVSAHWVASQLGCADFGAHRLKQYLSMLIGQQDFPPPLPALVSGNSRAVPSRPPRLEQSVTSNSRWRRVAVQAWLEDFLPPANAAQLDAQAMRAAADDMDASAGNLRLVSGRSA